MSKPGAADFDLSRVSAKDFDVVLPDGTRIKNIETAEDVRLAKEMFGDRLAAAVPPVGLPVFAPAVTAAIAAQQASSVSSWAKPKAARRPAQKTVMTRRRSRSAIGFAVRLPTRDGLYRSSRSCELNGRPPAGPHARFSRSISLADSSRSTASASKP